MVERQNGQSRNIKGQFTSKQRRDLEAYLGRVFAVKTEQKEAVIASMNRLYGSGLESQGIVLPVNKGQRAQLAGMLYQERFQGVPLTIASPVCPDYSYHHDLRTGQYFYDFKQLNNGVGLNAQTLLEAGQEFVNALTVVGLEEIRYLMILADVEVDDPEILARAGLCPGEFIRRVESSGKAIVERLNGQFGSNAGIMMMSSFLEEQDFQRATAFLARIRNSTLDGIIQSRTDMYRRWFGGGESISGFDEVCQRRVRTDVEKYLTFGMAARRNNVLVLEATAPKVASLYNFGDGRVAELGLRPLPPVPLVIIENSY